MINSELLNFAMTGSKRINQNTISPGQSIGLPWINDLMWAELNFLSTITPFNDQNLTDHIEENSD